MITKIIIVLSTNDFKCFIQGTYIIHSGFICFRMGYHLLFTLFFLISRRQNAKFFFKVTAEIFGVVKTYFIGNLRYMHLAFTQQLGCSFQPDNPDKLNGSLSGNLQQLLIKVDKSLLEMFSSTYFTAFSISFSSKDVMSISLGAGSMVDVCADR